MSKTGYRDATEADASLAKNEQERREFESNPVRRELRKAEATMVDLREWRIALGNQTTRMHDAWRALEQHRLHGRGANRR